MTKVPSRQSLARDYTVEEVAQALGMSTRWVRDRIKFDRIEHNRYGRFIRFTPDQVAALRQKYVVAKWVREPITTGPKRRRSA